MMLGYPSTRTKTANDQVGIMLVTMSVYVPKTSQLPPHSMQNLLVQYTYQLPPYLRMSD